MIKYIIIDDEVIAHKVIEEYCGNLQNLILQKNCYDALEATTYLRAHAVDLIFLDLNLPMISGFDFLKTLVNAPQVIVTTAYEEFALEGFNLNVVDYLLKPFSFARFLKAINKIVDAPSNSLIPKNRLQNDEQLPSSIFLKTDKKFVQVFFDDILFLEASRNYTKLFLKNEVLSIRKKISELIDLIPNDDFIKVHKSFVVAKQHIKNIEGNSISINDHLVPIGKVYKMNINNLLKKKGWH